MQCIELLGGGCLSDEMMAEVLRILKKLLTEHFERATERRQKRADEDYDEVRLLYLFFFISKSKIDKDIY